MWRGEVMLRPFSALMRAPFLFLIILGLRFLIGLCFPKLDQNVNEILLHTALFAIVFSLYNTAYRRPV